MVATRRHFQFTADAFRRALDAGVFRDPDAMQFAGGMIYDAPVGGEVPRPHHFTVDEYQQMGAVGILKTSDRIELPEGEIVGKPVLGPRHERCAMQLSRLAHRAVPDDLFVGVQAAIRLADDTAPEPDVFVTREWNFPHTNPTASDVLLIIAVADSSIREDRAEKLPRYARAGIPEAWLVELMTDTVERHTDPHDGQYRQITAARPGEILASVVVPALAIPVAEILR